MSATKSSTVKTLGTVSIVLGAVGGFVTIATFASRGALQEMAKRAQPTKQAPAFAELQQQMDALITRYQSTMDAFSAVYVVLAVALIGVGIALRGQTVRARKAALGWASVALLYALGHFAFEQIVLMPKVQALMENMMSMSRLAGRSTPVDDIVAMAMRAGTTMGSVMGFILAAAYPIVLAVLLGRRSARSELAD